MKKQNSLRSIMRGRVVLFGIGSLLKSDDAAGPLLVERLKGRVTASCINAENAPERFFGEALRAHPDTLLIIDAVHLGEEPGSYRLLRPEELTGSGITTHDIPLGELLELFTKESGVDIWVLGIQPERLEIAEGLSSRVQKTVDELEKLLIEAAPQ
ncbi:MAG TPA: hydrogenase 3 maturation endopeptidase HyCI [Spirochaetota bacterium]|nr:hydrogenase 3 maturation endopeptidase HyCI [Spirochaetota bacterium]